MDLSCPSNVCNKFIRKNRFWAFLRFGSPLLILRKNEGIITNSCSVIKQARSRGKFDDNYTPLSTIKPQLILLSRHWSGPRLQQNLHPRLQSDPDPFLPDIFRYSHPESEISGC